MIHIFIVNPAAGLIDRTEYIRSMLGRRKDIQSIVFVTEDAGNEYEIMKEMLEVFDDEPARIYICGGSGTLSNAINALSEDDFEHVEIGFYPCGLTNDFLKNFGSDSVHFEDLNAVIDGKVRHVDYMECHGGEGVEETYNELLFSTLGIPAKIQDLANVFNLIGRIRPTLLYAICSLISAPFSGAVDYEITVDGVNYDGEYKIVYVGNSVCLGGGFFPIRNNISCQDGVINMIFIKKFPITQFFKYLQGFMRGDYAGESRDNVVFAEGRKVSISRKDGKQMTINTDGEIVKADRWDMEVIHNKLKFIVPRNAEFCKNFDKIISRV